VSPHYLQTPVQTLKPLLRSTAIAGLAALAAGAFGGCTAAGVALAPSGGAVAVGATGDGVSAQVQESASRDIDAVADDMAQGILAVPRISNAKSTPRIVIGTVANNTGRPMDQSVFVVRMRILLNQKAVNRARFLNDAMLASLEADRVPGFRGVDFLLSGRVDPASAGSATPGSVVASFRLTDTRSSAVVWEGAYAIGANNLTIPLAVTL